MDYYVTPIDLHKVFHADLIIILFILLEAIIDSTIQLISVPVFLVRFHCLI